MDGIRGIALREDDLLLRLRRDDAALGRRLQKRGWIKPRAPLGGGMLRLLISAPCRLAGVPTPMCIELLTLSCSESVAAALLPKAEMPAATIMSGQSYTDFLGHKPSLKWRWAPPGPP